ncbi:hypothetical protein VNI00_014457 [Paramarasmius palmivorus]|uniref:BTB domain-containing protein n=1 Tax=Paramarasmius palmivorus TaxID=297713 RepID=A0AAW0BRM1_9AGAR
MPSLENQPHALACPVDECSFTVDIAVKSSDGRTFGAHMKNLEWFTEGFPLGNSVTSTIEEPVVLMENGDVTELLLAFTHNSPAPDLTSRSLDTVIGLADAADKYGVYHALTACRQTMRLLSEESERNALGVLKSKLAHSNLEDIDYIAPMTMKLKIEEALDFFGENHTKEFCRWLRYQQTYLMALEKYRKAISELPIRHKLPDIVDPKRPSWANINRTVVCPQFANFSRSVLAVLEETSSVGFPTPTTFRRTVKFVEALPGVPTPCLCGVDAWSEKVVKILEDPPKWSK